MWKKCSGAILASLIGVFALGGPALAVHDCPNDQDLWPFQWQGVKPDGTAWVLGADRVYGTATWDGTVTGLPGPEDVDKNADGVFDADPNIVCKHLSSGDGFAQMADSPSNYQEGYIYTLGFTDVTGVPYDEALEWGLNGGQSPAPTIKVGEGQELYLALSNAGMMMRPDLFDPHTIHWHGFPQASAIYDGVPDNSVSVNMGSTWTYYYKVPGPGTYLYHCHVEATEHMQMGMMGNLYVTPTQDGASYTYAFDGRPARTYTTFAYDDGDGSTGYDVDYPVQLMAFDSVFHEKHIAVQPLPFAEMEDDLFLINGRGYPDTVVPTEMGYVAPNGVTLSQQLSSLITATQGETILLRVSMVGVTGFETLTVLGIPMRVVGKDAKLLRGPSGTDLSYVTNSITLGGGESFDVLLYTDDVVPGTYYLYTRTLDQLNNSREDRGGAMTEIVIQ